MFQLNITQFLKPLIVLPVWLSSDDVCLRHKIQKIFNDNREVLKNSAAANVYKLHTNKHMCC